MGVKWSRDQVLEELKAIVGDENVLHEEYDLLTYARDRYPPLSHPRQGVMPLAVVRPGSTEEVRQIVLLANKYLIPLTPRGAGTNFAGSAVPKEGGIVVDMTRMNKVLEVDELSMTVRAQAGIVIQHLEEELNKHGLTLGHDPGSFPSATLGGCISTAALGWRAGKYGDIGQMVLGLEVVLPTGEILRTRSITKASTGFDIKRLFIGAEGTLGIITEATLRVHPMPEEFAILYYGFKDFETAFYAQLKVFRKGLRPAMSLVYEEEIEGPSGEKLGGSVTIVYEGVKEIVDAQVRLTEEIFKREGGVRLSDEEAWKFWEERHDMYSFMNREGQYDALDTAVPIPKVIEFYRFLRDWVRRHGLKDLGISSWVYPENISIDVAFDPEKADEYIRARDEAAKKALELGGTLSYCVGIGIRYPHLMEEEHGVGFKVMKAIKKALDPNNIMNPGGLGL